MPTIRAIASADRAAVLALATRSALFDADGLALVGERLDQYLAGSADRWYASIVDEAPDAAVAGVVYCAPEAMTEGTWNILMLIVAADTHGQGHGRALMQQVEGVLMAEGARLLLVETSSLDGFERARAFYPACGYQEVARIPAFYAAGDDKVIFTKALR